jgi:hypothetical protein
LFEIFCSKIFCSKIFCSKIFCSKFSFRIFFVRKRVILCHCV